MKKKSKRKLRKSIQARTQYLANQRVSSKQRTQSGESHIKIQTFKGVQEYAKLLQSSQFKKDIGLSGKQNKELKQVFKKIRQAEKKQSSSAQKSAMQAFYRTFGLTATGQITEQTNEKLFQANRKRFEKGKGFEVRTFAKVPVYSSTVSGSPNMRTLSDLADNLDKIEEEIFFFNVQGRVNSKFVDEYVEWADAFQKATGLDGVATPVMNLIDWFIQNKDLLNQLVDWLHRYNTEIDLTGNIWLSLMQALEVVEQNKAPHYLKNFLINTIHRAW